MPAKSNSWFIELYPVVCLSKSPQEHGVPRQSTVKLIRTSLAAADVDKIATNFDSFISLFPRVITADQASHVGVYTDHALFDLPNPYREVAKFPLAESKMHRIR